MTPAEVIDIFTRQVIAQPDEGFEDEAHYCEWFREEGAPEIAVIGQALMEARTAKDVRRGLTALRKHIESAKPPKGLGKNQP